MMEERNCPRCATAWLADHGDRNKFCPHCRSEIGRAKQKAIQRAVRKKEKKEGVEDAGK